MVVNMKTPGLSRRTFLKLGAAGAAGLAALPVIPAFAKSSSVEEFPVGDLLGRNCSGGKIEMRSRPSFSAPSVGTFYEDAVFPWLREVVGEAPAGRYSRRWVETPQGYLYAPVIQPVRNLPNQVVTELPSSGLGKGMWVEVTVPYLETFMERGPSSPWMKESVRPRLYYGQVIWVDDVNTNSDGVPLYRVNELYGSYGDIYWCEASGMRPLTADEIAPINPDVADKRVVVDLNHQTLSCYEGNNEVYFCRISSGAKFNASGEAVDKWSTPPGPHPIWRKLISIHMSGGTTGGGWDIAGVGWTSLFAGTGVAIHSCFWHNDYGTPRSNGCVNARPEDSKWIFRWTTPHVSLDPGDQTVSMPGGTIVDVVEKLY